MRKERKSLTVTAALAGTISLSGVAEARNLMLPPVPGFVEGYRQTQGQNAILELVPRGQNVNNYTKMVTMQRVAGTRVPANRFLAEFARRYQASCPRAAVLAQPMGVAGGVRLDCPRHPRTGRTETVLARAIDDGTGIYLVHFTFKYIPAPGETRWARDYLGRVGFTN
ncbi:hypothetical protein [Sphingomonas crusticola]|uniref:hypothetical protein n=1 Tax=Sphingomonas crusticola TaxID=1697973 RepID=UPI0013C2A668|nr:hypothetical protein [Sphingomonas crusticola]